MDKLFIGLSDKTNKKIFEGDIIKYYGKVLLVEYDLDSGVKLRVLNKPFSDNFIFDSSSILKKRADIEIIGNKFDNPEMLVAQHTKIKLDLIISLKTQKQNGNTNR